MTPLVVLLGRRVPPNVCHPPTLLRVPDNSVSGPDSKSTQLPMCASSGSTWRRARLSLGDRRTHLVQHLLLALADLRRAEPHESALLGGVGGGRRRGDQPRAEPGRRRWG